MQPNSSERGAHAGNGLSLSLQPELLTRTPAPGDAAAAAAANHENNEVRVPMTSGGGDSSGGASSRRCRINSHSHSHSQSHAHTRAQHHSNSEPELDPPDSDLDSGEPSTSLSELRCLFRWLQKSLPFLIILCAKLVIQHALGELRDKADSITAKTDSSRSLSSFSGLAVGVGLFTTFLYVNKSIQTQVFLQVGREHKTHMFIHLTAVRVLNHVFVCARPQDRHSKLQCAWLLLFLTSSTLLLYYTFLTETLYYW